MKKRLLIVLFCISISAKAQQIQTDENTTDEEKINMIKKRVSSFFDDKNFIFPAINSSDIIDTDYSNSEIWNDIKSNPKALGFYYLIGDELGCKLAYSKKQKKIVKYFCCC
jgi:hypothetical protein